MVKSNSQINQSIPQEFATGLRQGAEAALETVKQAKGGKKVETKPNTASTKGKGYEGPKKKAPTFPINKTPVSLGVWSLSAKLGIPDNPGKWGIAKPQKFWSKPKTSEEKKVDVEASERFVQDLAKGAFRGFSTGAQGLAKTSALAAAKIFSDIPQELQPTAVYLPHPLGKSDGNSPDGKEMILNKSNGETPKKITYYENVFAFSSDKNNAYGNEFTSYTGDEVKNGLLQSDQYKRHHVYVQVQDPQHGSIFMNLNDYQTWVGHQLAKTDD